MKRSVVCLFVFLLVSCSAIVVAGDGGFNGLPLGIDLPNTSDVDYGWVRIADDDGLEPQTLTIEAWIHPLGNGFGTTSTNAGTCIVSKPMESTGGSYLGSWFMYWAPPTHQNSGKFYVSVQHQLLVSGTNMWSVSTVPIGTSGHIAMTFDGTWLRVFINGEEDDASPVQASSSVVDYGDQDVLIGASNFLPPWLYRFEGIIDEVRIWDHARSEGEIAGQMNCALSGDEPGLLAYYSFNMGDAWDDSGNGHHGVIEGAADYVDFTQDCMILFDGFDTGDLTGWQ